MFRKKLIIVKICVVLLASALVVTCSKQGQASGNGGAKQTAPEFNFNIGFSPNEESINYAIATKAKELMEQKSGGRVTMTILQVMLILFCWLRLSMLTLCLQ